MLQTWPEARIVARLDRNPQLLDTRQVEAREKGFPFPKGIVPGVAEHADGIAAFPEGVFGNLDDERAVVEKLVAFAV